MKVGINEEGYVYIFSDDETYWDENAEYFTVPDDFLEDENFLNNRLCYKYDPENKTLIYEESRKPAVEIINKQRDIRELREQICFPYINRGELWYNKLTAEQKEEYDEWYQAWLDAPQTLVIPEKPLWLT